jgi:hypothetical protein
MIELIASRQIAHALLVVQSLIVRLAVVQFFGCVGHRRSVL